MYRAARAGPVKENEALGKRKLKRGTITALIRILEKHLVWTRSTLTGNETAAEYQELAARFKAQAATAGISPKRATLLTNISRTYAALASQFAMLHDDMKADRSQK